MVSARKTWMTVVVLAAAAPAASARDGISADQFGRLRDLIRPQPGESHWRDVAWLTSLHEARVQAAATGKPILLWSAGGAPPLGGC